MKEKTRRTFVYYDPESGIEFIEPSDVDDDKDRGLYGEVVDLPVRLIEDLIAAHAAVRAASNAVTKFLEKEGYDTEDSYFGGVRRIENLSPERKREVRYRKFCDKYREEYRAFCDSLTKDKHGNRLGPTVEQWARAFRAKEWREMVEVEKGEVNEL